ncbi:MAG: M14 family zinc carboxypeptidase [Candidatus Thermoplasmatota archaeon]
MKLESIGYTFEGRDIWMIKLSDNVNQNENEPGVLFMWAHHGN